jgi:hypothetical protein
VQGAEGEAAADEDDGVLVRASGEHDAVGRRHLGLLGVGERREERASGFGERFGTGEVAAVGGEDDAGANVCRQLAQVIEGELGRQRRRHGVVSRIPPVPLSKIAWLTTVVICLVASLILLLSGYLGYAGVVFAVALAAGINLL